MSGDFRNLRDADQDSLWITYKAARLGAYQKLADDAFAFLEAGWDEDPKTAGMLNKVITTCLRSAAEELGQLSPRDTGERTQVDVHLHNVDLGTL